MELYVNIRPMNNGGNLLAMASVKLDGCFVVTGFRVMNSSKGIFVAMPSYKVGEMYKDLVFPITAEFREKLNTSIIDEYNKKVGNKQTTEKQEYYETAPSDDLPF